MRDLIIFCKSKSLQMLQKGHLSINYFLLNRLKWRGVMPK